MTQKILPFKVFNYPQVAKKDGNQEVLEEGDCLCKATGQALGLKVFIRATTSWYAGRQCFVTISTNFQSWRVNYH
jgi:hypothetical protein